jgi:aspartyl protease family protein
MNGEDAPQLIWAVGALVLVMSSLLAYRLPIGQTVKMVLGWIGIFALAFLVMSFRPEMKAIWERVKGELTSAPRQVVEGKAIKLTRQDDGHFWVRAEINNKQIDFMVDSGATTTAINADTANQIGLDMGKASGAVELDTANGAVWAKVVTVPKMSVGDFIFADHSAVVAQEFGDTNVVGMNFLDTFTSWNVERDVMTLRP